MKKIFNLILTVIVIVAAVYFGPKLVHKCDGCDKWFFGAGYEANIIADVVKDDDQTICKACAEKQHILETALGKDLADFKKSLIN